MSAARSGWSVLLRSRKWFSSLLELSPFMGLAASPKSTAIPGIVIGDSAKRLQMAFKSAYVRQYIALANNGAKELPRCNGLQVPYRGNQIQEHAFRGTSLFQLVKGQGAGGVDECFARSFASKASKRERQSSSETTKEVQTVEDPFDSPTYNIPEKPVTFAEGASYSVIILAGLGVAVAAGYAVFKELIFEPKEYKVFNKALKRIQDDSQVRVRIGSPITGYGQESRNRAARQRIPNKIFTDEDGIEHVQVGFFIRGPHGAGKVAAEMFKDKVDKQWKYTYLIVQIMQPSPSQLILESYMPAPTPVPA